MSLDEENATKVLQSVFGYKDFKNDVQRQATMAVMEGSKYVFISMPRGFGRSLCYLLPVILQKGKVALIISPKISASENHVNFLKSKGIKACLLHQPTYLKKKKAIVEDLASDSPTIKLLFITPKIAAIPYFQLLTRSLTKRKMLSYVVFDEAHCLSEWGSDYMPSYKKISLLNKIYEYVPRIAVTTTVTDKVVEDICEVLTLRTPKVFRMLAQPISVHCDVQFIDQLSDPFEHLKNFIVKVLRLVNTDSCKMHEGYAIVYCRNAVTTELIRNKLSDVGISALMYDSKLENAVRHNVENIWMSGNAEVIITTHDYEFIHKKRIRCTAYFTIPENIPKYYRECAQMYTGRSRAYSRIYFSVEEYINMRLLLKNNRKRNEPECIEGRLREHDKLVSYCLSINCRHKNIIKYFGDVIPPCKMNCDICKNKNVVEAKTYKFITRSKKVNGVIYNISTLNENLRNRRTSKNDKQIPMARDKLPQIEENRLPDESSQHLLIEIDEVAVIPRRELAVGSSIRHANEDGEIKKGEKCRVSKSDSCEVIDVFNKPRKRSCAAAAWPEEFKSKMRKLESENKPPNETRINRNEEAEDRNRRRVERIEGDANEGVTRDLDTADYLMNKYKLNKDSITLVPRRK